MNNKINEDINGIFNALHDRFDVPKEVADKYARLIIKNPSLLRSRLQDILDSNQISKAEKMIKDELYETIKTIRPKDIMDVPDYHESYKDGQLEHNWYNAQMTDIDVIENILDKFSKHGVTHKFSGSDLIITAGTTSHFPQAQVLDDLRYTLNDVVQQLKKLYKEATGKTLDIQKEKTSTIDVTSNYTTGHMGMYKVTNIYELPKSPSSDDKSLEKHELNEVVEGGPGSGPRPGKTSSISSKTTTSLASPTKVKSKKELANHANYWAEEAIDSAAQEGTGLNFKDLYDTIINPPGEESIEDKESQKLLKNYLKNNWNKLRQQYKDKKSDYKEEN